MGRGTVVSKDVEGGSENWKKFKPVRKDQCVLNKFRPPIDGFQSCEQ